MGNYVIVGGEMYHHGVKGQKWGVRRYQNKDGSLTAAGKRRYTPIIEGKLKAEKYANDARREAYKSLNASPKKHSKFQYEITAERAAYAARKKSVIEQKEANRQAREEHRQARSEKKDANRQARADQNIRRIEKTRKQNELEYEEMNATSRDRFGGKDKKLNRSLAANKALFDDSEISNRYSIARQKAKKDKSYKDSEEYKSAKKAFGKQATQKLVYGEVGSQRIEQLKNMGVGEKQAKGRAVAEQLLTLAVVGGVAVGTMYLGSKR